MTTIVKPTICDIICIYQARQLRKRPNVKFDGSDLASWPCRQTSEKQPNQQKTSSVQLLTKRLKAVKLTAQCHRSLVLQQENPL